MPTTYEAVPADIPAMTEEILDQHHPELTEAKVRIGYLFAFNAKGFAVKLHGYPCSATIKVNSYKDRKEGKADATITIDGTEWFLKTDEERRALIDHELYHLVVARDRKTGQIKEDALGRPKLKGRLHDWQLGGFRAIAERHGEAAAEVQAARHLDAKFGQLLWEWGDEDGGRRKRRKKATGQSDGAVAGSVGIAATA